MYFIRSTSSSHRVPFPTLDRAIARLQSTLLGIERRGGAVAFNDRLEYEIAAGPVNSVRLIWIEDDHGLHVLSEEPCLDC
ncbi:hypothetical protein EON77_07155 [bacterium]|nr:MAG: hypothetical protein EON77_07155 [bacterium]